MKKYCLVIFLTLTLAFGSLFNVALATWQPGELSILSLKMTGSEMVVIGNITDKPINLQNYMVQYFNKAVPVSLVTPTTIQALPDFILSPKQSFVLTGDSAATCGAAGVANLAMSLSDTGGYLNLMKISQQPDNSILYDPQDHVSWTSTTTGADLVKVPSATTDPKAVWYRKISDGTWQQVGLGSNCTLFLTLSAAVPNDNPSYIDWTDGEEPLAIVIEPTDQPIVDEAKTYSGLAAPKIIEILPNPAEPQTDSEDEFIELYNPNDSVFDLSGFKVQVGMVSLRSYTFPENTQIPAKGFVSFNSASTGLSLTNSGGQVRLIDPLGTAISQTDTYGPAKDGQAWALANGKWYWTTMPTPNANNIINQPLTISALSVGSTKKTSTTKKATTTKAAAKPKVKAAKATKAKIQPASVTSPSQTSPQPVHFWILAGIGVAAAAYALYEYRNDLVNSYHRFRNR